MKGTIQDKLKLCFNIFDSDKSGYLHKAEIMNLTKAIRRSILSRVKSSQASEDFSLKLMIAHIRKKFRKISEKYEGMVSFQDFYSSI